MSWNRWPFTICRTPRASMPHALDTLPQVLRALYEYLTTVHLQRLPFTYPVSQDSLVNNIISQLEIYKYFLFFLVSFVHIGLYTTCITYKTEVKSFIILNTSTYLNMTRGVGPGYCALPPCHRPLQPVQKVVNRTKKRKRLPQNIPEYNMFLRSTRFLASVYVLFRTQLLT